MALQDGFYAEPYEAYVEPDALANSRELVVSAVLASVNATHPGVLGIETSPPTSLEYGEALQQYARLVGNTGYRRTMIEFGSLPVRKLLSVDEGSIPAQQLFDEESEERRGYYQQAFDNAEQATWLDAGFPAGNEVPIGDFMKAELIDGGRLPKQVELIGDSAKGALFTRTLIQIQSEKRHLLSVVSRQSMQLGRWATGSLLRTS